jgi:hypothetical protein
MNDAVKENTKIESWYISTPFDFVIYIESKIIWLRKSKVKSDWIIYLTAKTLFLYIERDNYNSSNNLHKESRWDQFNGPLKVKRRIFVVGGTWE